MSDVEMRALKSGDTTPKGVTASRISKFQNKRTSEVSTKSSSRTAAEKKRYEDDLKNSLSIGSRMRAEGRTPGADVGGRSSSANTNLGAKAKDVPASPTPKQAVRERAAAGLTKPIKPRNPGRNAPAAKQERYKEKMSQYEKDLASYQKRMDKQASKTKAIDEGRLKTDGTPKGATAKSIARNKRKVDKAGAEGPKIPTPKSSSATSRKPSTDLVRVPKTRGQKASGADVKSGRVFKVGPAKGKDIELARAKEIARRAGVDPAGAKKGKGGKRLLTGAGVVGAVGAAGYAFDKSGAGKGGSKSTSAVESPKKQVLRDKYGRQIGREEYNRREKFRASLEGKSPKQVEKMRKAEAKRRSEWRKTEGKKKFGNLASKKSRNLDVPAWVSVRKKRQGPASPQWLAERERFK